MENDELKELLQNDVPEVDYDSKAILHRCKQENNKFRIHKQKISYVLSSIITVLIIVFSIVFIYYKNNKEIRDINNAINNLEKIESDETRMLEIMKIENKVTTLSDVKRNNINLSKLSLETKTTTIELKKAVKWNDELNNQVNYYSFDEITLKQKVEEVYVKKGKESNITFRITNELSNNLIKSIDIPYIDIINNQDTFYNDYESELSGNTNDYCNIQVYFRDNINETFFNIYVYGSGFVLIKETKLIDEEEVLIKAFISLIPLDYPDFKKTYGAYFIDSEFYFCDIISDNEIEYLAITESTNKALLGENPIILTDTASIDDYYKNYLNDLKFIENDELVNSIIGKEGDNMSITIALFDGDLISIIINLETYEYHLSHGIMSYAGSGRFKIE